MRVLFASTPGLGHVHPMLPLAKAFAAGGNDVCWATGADALGGLEREGISAVVAGATRAESMEHFVRSFPEVRDKSPEELPGWMFPRLFGVVRAPMALDDLVRITSERPPDLVIHEVGDMAAPLAAALVSAPNVCHGFGTVIPQQTMANAAELVANLWRAHGLEPPSYCGSYQHLYLDLYPPRLSSQTERPPCETQLIRPGVDTFKADEQLPGFVGKHEPVVYVTLGTVFSSTTVLTTIVQGASSLPVEVVVTVGPDGDPTSLGRQPPNVHVARYIAQKDLLPRCSAVVSHAGSGTFLAAVQAKLPQVFVPQAADQFRNAEAGSRAGVGVQILPGELTSAAVTEALQRVLSTPTYQRAAIEVAEEIAMMPSAEDVAQLLQHRFG